MKAIKKILQFTGFGVGAMIFSHAVSVSGATASVVVGPGGSFAFSPATTNIFVGDTVIWTWPSGSFNHNVVSDNDPQAWPDSAVASGPFTFTNKFTGTGTFPYECSVHGFTGSVVVAAAAAPTVSVLVGSGGFTFTPATVSIPVGGRVIWTWAGSGHTTTSGTVGASSVTPNGLWDSGLKSTPSSFTNTFASAATFTYYCTPHAISFGMKGSVVVTNLTAPNVPPTVTLTNPVSGVTLSAPASLTLKANVADTDGTIASVQFLQGATSLGTVTTAPFSLAVNNLAAANYSFSAIATDNGGATATNSATVNVINASPVNIAATSFIAANHFQFSYSSDIGLTYLVLASTNLINWTPLNTNTASVNPTIFVDPNASAGGSFYRVGRLPNP
jgi:plastocyanin